MTFLEGPTMSIPQVKNGQEWVVEAAVQVVVLWTSFDIGTLGTFCEFHIVSIMVGK